MPSEIGIAAACVAVGLTLGGLASLQLVFSHLSKHHPGSFAKLGRPSIVPWKGGFRDSLAFHRGFRFVVSKRYKELGSPELDRLCGRARLLYNLWGVMAIAFLLLPLQVNLKGC